MSTMSDRFARIACLVYAAVLGGFAGLFHVLRVGDPSVWLAGAGAVFCVVLALIGPRSWRTTLGQWLSLYWSAQ